jgi:hypothetical protein
MQGIETALHLPAQSRKFCPRLGSLGANLGLDALEAPIDLLVQAIEALVGPTLSHRLHQATLADNELRMGRVFATSFAEQASCRSLSEILRGMAKRSIAMLAGALVAAALTVAAVPAAAPAQVPWGAGCASSPPSEVRTSATCGASLVDGRAIAPADAPTVVKQAIAAANQIVGRPYIWGGGHASWFARGYDCSGAVGYALHGAGLLEVMMVSGQLASWEEGGIGRWITVYANPDHVFMVVAGLRFDTRGNLPGVSGPRWHMASVDPRGFVARHPAGF